MTVEFAAIFKSYALITLYSGCDCGTRTITTTKLPTPAQTSRVFSQEKIRGQSTGNGQKCDGPGTKISQIYVSVHAEHSQVVICHYGACNVDPISK